MNTKYAVGAGLFASLLAFPSYGQDQAKPAWLETIVTTVTQQDNFKERSPLSLYDRYAIPNIAVSLPLECKDKPMDLPLTLDITVIDSPPYKNPTKMVGEEDSLIITGNVKEKKSYILIIRDDKINGKLESQSPFAILPFAQLECPQVGYARTLITSARKERKDFGNQVYTLIGTAVANYLAKR